MKRKKIVRKADYESPVIHSFAIILEESLVVGSKVNFNNTTGFPQVEDQPIDENEFTINF